MTDFKFFIILLVISIGSINAQQYEVGLMVGGGNYVGDIGKEYYFYPNKVGGGIVFKRTINQWFSIRFNLNYFQINAKDSEAESKGRKLRGFSSTGQILHFSSGIEYNFIVRNPFLRIQSLHKLTPYFYLGVGIGNYTGTFYSSNGNNTGMKYDGTHLNIPMVLGLKYKATSHFIIALETGAYYYLTDNLDGTYAFFHNEDKILKDGTVPTTNLNSNDWYTFTSIGFIYTFGDLTCYFNLF